MRVGRPRRIVVGRVEVAACERVVRVPEPAPPAVGCDDAARRALEAGDVAVARDRVVLTRGVRDGPQERLGPGQRAALEQPSQHERDRQPFGGVVEHRERVHAHAQAVGAAAGQADHAGRCEDDRLALRPASSSEGRPGRRPSPRGGPCSGPGAPRGPRRPRSPPGCTRAGGPRACEYHHSSSIRLKARIRSNDTAAPSAMPRTSSSRSGVAASIAGRNRVAPRRPAT